MAGTVSGLHRFADDVGPIPLALLDNNYNALQTAINTLETYSNFYLDTGTLNNVNVVTDSTQYVSYADGLQLAVRIANTNTGPATLNINSLGAKPIWNGNYAPLTQNELVAGHTTQFIYSAWANAFIIGGGGAGGDVLVSSTAPGNPIPGQFWFNSATGQLAIWFGGAWVAATCCTGSPGSGGTISGALFAPPFNIGDCFQVAADCSAFLGKGLSMGADGHTWLYNGLTTYPLGGINAAPGTPSIAVHGNDNSTGGWISFIQDTGTAENYIGGLGGGNVFSEGGPTAISLLAPNGFAMGTTVGSQPCMWIDSNCNVTFRNNATVLGTLSGGTNVTTPVNGVTPPAGSNSNQLATTAFVQAAVAAGAPGATVLAANGYTTLPGGIIIQWGSVTAPAGEFPVDIAVTFPKAFPHACWHVNATTLRSIARAGEANLASHFVDYITTTGCTVVIDNQGNPSTYYGQWLAIGY